MCSCGCVCVWAKILIRLGLKVKWILFVTVLPFIIQVLNKKLRFKMVGHSRSREGRVDV